MKTTTHTAIVTGGSRGIGRAIVKRLSADGARVLTCGRGERPDELDDAVLWFSGDVSSPADAQRMLAVANDAFGPVSLLVNNAGVQVEKTLMDTTDRDWELVLGVNCTGVFNMSRAVLPQMTEHGGVIINVGSISGDVADGSMAAYNASKAFVHGLTRSIAVDHGPHVRCNAVQPGWIMTEMAEDAFALARDPEAARRDGLARTPAGRFGQPVDIANAVAWLASEESDFITGQCITIDGGLTVASPMTPGAF
ncbi:meso-butanediol dehydrogenase/(S,S)-butanediol dehydrogenase/diacetyl reductase [Paeniglutamicibacter cryotolerans]|uniref:Meso-butanediol dehydrogenase/(S,S)-butanediol dehydrogenase/diacetyl reductase n=2 Tax=Paeniglutamicibacter cryotolerans TaxID=670079 RepID=A0A839QIV0_9MICC|nr:meso-butanediol dehydrogenase/(S,S)-butanediol dehydrogenase/diacetyl reductase [Paeniglutamicibacter cryotolerans]